MGFTCLICQGPFDQSASSPANGGGDCGTATFTRCVSAISKCGHLFHADCLKKSLDAQSSNAWVSKSCPSCGTTIAIQDIFRVQACHKDNRPSQRQREEELISMHKKLQRDYEIKCQELESARIQLGQRSSEYEALKHQKDELGQAVDGLRRLSLAQKNETERYRIENETLRNIIVSLTAKHLTGPECTLNDIYGSSPTGNGRPNSVRHDFMDDFNGSMGLDATPILQQGLLGATNMSMKPGNNHPPGFQFPMRKTSESNGTECQQFQRVACRTESISDMDGMNNNENGYQQKGFSVVPGSQMPIRKLAANFPNEMKVEFDSNNNAGNSANEPKKPLGMYSMAVTKDCNFPMKKPSPPPVPVAGVKFADKPRTVETAKGQSHESDEGPDGNDSQDKWLEKRGRRRGGSGKSSRGTSRGDRVRDNNSESDRKLYGSFQCPKCDAHWGSSQSVLNTPQTCRVCKTIVHPYSQGPILSRKQLELGAKPETKKRN